MRESFRPVTPRVESPQTPPSNEMVKLTSEQINLRVESAETELNGSLEETEVLLTGKDDGFFNRVTGDTRMENEQEQLSTFLNGFMSGMFAGTQMGRSDSDAQKGAEEPPKTFSIEDIGLGTLAALTALRLLGKLFGGLRNVVTTAVTGAGVKGSERQQNT